MQLSVYAIPNLISFFAIFSLGWFVFIKRYKTQVGISFFFLTMSAAAWQLGTFFVLSASRAETALLFCRLTYMGSLFIPITTYHFTIAILDKVNSEKKFLSIIYLIGIVFFLPLSQSNLFIEGVYEFAWGFWWKCTKLHLLFLVFVTCLMSLSFFKLWMSVRNAMPGIERTRKIYILAALIIAYLGAVDYVPNYGIRVYPFGYFPLFVYFLITTYAIVRYKLLDVEVIVRRTIIFAGIVVAAVSAIAIPFGLIQTFIGKALGLPDPFILMTIGIITTVLIYRSVEQMLVNVTDRYLFQKKTDYRKLLKEASREMAAIKSLKKLSRVVVGFLVTKARIKSAAAFVYMAQDKAYKLQACRPLLKNAEDLLFEETHPLVQELKRLQGPIEKEGLQNQIRSASDPGHKEQWAVCCQTLQTLNAEAAVPSFLYLEDHQKHNHSGSVLRSILFLGSKKSDDIYTAEDLDVFHTLAQESAIAIENARLYDEAIQKTRENMSLKLEIVRKERKQTLGNLAGSIAHEVKGPIQLIQLSTAAIRRLFPRITGLFEAVDPDTRKKRFDEIMDGLPKYLGRIDDENDRLLTTTTTISKFAKIEDIDFRKLSKEELAKIEKHKIGVHAFMNLIIEKARIQCQGRGDYAFELDTSRLAIHTPPIKMNQNLLEQVITNLLFNAYDSLKGRETKKISMDAHIDSDNPEFVHVEIGDTGCGMPDEIKEKVWEPEFSTKLKEGKGTGMGLYWCKFLMEEVHPGRISFDSTVGVGTTFHLRIPVWREDS